MTRVVGGHQIGCLFSPVHKKDNESERLIGYYIGNDEIFFLLFLSFFYVSYKKNAQNVTHV